MPANPLQNLCTARFAIGGGAWLVPNLAGRLFGLDPKNNPQAAFLGRLFGVRDVALAAGALSSSGESRRLWLRLGLACDALDAVAALLAARNGTLPKHAAALSAVAAGSAIALGAAALSAPTD